MVPLFDNGDLRRTQDWQEQGQTFGQYTASELLHESVKHSLSANFLEKEYFATEARLSLSVHLFRFRLPTTTKPYPHAISILP